MDKLKDQDSAAPAATDDKKTISLKKTSKNAKVIINPPEKLDPQRGFQERFKVALTKHTVILEKKTEIVLNAKATSAELPEETIKQVYTRGYKTLPLNSDLTREQYAMNRVNSFIAGGAAMNEDYDLLPIVERIGMKGTGGAMRPHIKREKNVYNGKTVFHVINAKGQVKHTTGDEMQAKKHLAQKYNSYMKEDTLNEAKNKLDSDNDKFKPMMAKLTPQRGKGSFEMKIKEANDPGEYDQEGDMAMTQLRSIIHNAQQLHDQLKPSDNLPEWVQSKITLAQDYMQTAYDYMYSEKNEEVVAEGLLNELSKDTLKSYAKKAVPDMQASQKRSEIEAGKAVSTKDDETARTHYDAAKQAKDRTEKRMAGISGAIKRVTNQGVAEEIVQEERGLWANIHAKRKRIKAGSGERMRKPGSEGAPTIDALKKSAVKEEIVSEMDKSQTPPGRDGSNDEGGKKEYTAKIITPKKAVKDGEKILNKMLNKKPNVVEASSPAIRMQRALDKIKADRERRERLAAPYVNSVFDKKDEKQPQEKK